MLNLGKIDHIHVRVDNLTQALGWYQRVLWKETATPESYT